MFSTADFCEGGVRGCERCDFKSVRKHERLCSPCDLATFLATTVSETRGELWSIPTDEHKARFYNEIQHSLRKSLTLSSQVLKRKKAILAHRL